MNKRLESKLVKKFPKLYKDYGGDPKKTCMAAGIDVGDGWYGIIYQVSCLLEKSIKEVPECKNMSAEQVKEKFGGLRFYIKGVKSREGLEHVGVTIRDAEEMSLVICEDCGKPGKRTTTAMGWIKTLCPQCKKKGLAKTRE